MQLKLFRMSVFSGELHLEFEGIKVSKEKLRQVMLERDVGCDDVQHLSNACPLEDKPQIMADGIS